MSELERILYVEDDPAIQAIAKISLETVGGFEVRVCSSGAEALAAAPDFAPQLVLLDVMMPEMDGVETFQELRKLPGTAETPIVFLTAVAQEHELARYRELGALEVFVKPFDPMTLPAELRRVWEAGRD